MSKLVPVPIAPPPGVVVTESDRVAEGRWVLPFDKIRFVHGRPQKIGGNVRATSTAMSGTPRATLCWQDYLQNGYISCGTYRKLYAFDNAFELTDITPFRATGTLGTNPFTCTAGSTSIEVTQSAHGVNVGDTVIFSGATSYLNPLIFFDTTTEGSGNHYYYNGSTYSSFAALLSAISGAYTNSTGKYVTNSSGVLTKLSANTLPFDYSPTSIGTCLGLLLEGASTNLFEYSNAFSTSPWSPNGDGSLSSGATTSPDGTSNAWGLFPAGTGSRNPFLVQDPTITAGIYTVSVYVKDAGQHYFQIGSAANNQFANFNLSTGALGSTGGTGFVSSSITNVGNGWYRCTATFTQPSTSLDATFCLIGSATAGYLAAYTVSSTSNGVYIYFAQAENLPFASSPIATTSSTASRSADALSFPWAATTATFLAAINNALGPASNQAGIIADSTGGDPINLTGSTTLRAFNSASQYLTGTVSSTSGANAMGISGSATGRTLTANGATPVSDSHALFSSTPATLYLGVYSPGVDSIFGHFQQFGGWSGYAATSAELQALTSSPTYGSPSWLPVFSGDLPNMNGTFIAQTVIDTSHYTVTATSTPTVGATFGGSSVAYEYEISVGTELGTYGQGWGTGQWGLGTWGTARGSSTIFFEPRVWSLDHFGDVLVATYNGGALWFFDPTQGEPWPRAVSTFEGSTVNGAPSTFRALFVTPERFIVGLCPDMVLNVCSQGDPTTWTPATTNTAFARTLQFGTKLVDGLAVAPFISLVWSDSALYLMQYTGSQFIYNTSVAGLDCGLISPNGAVAVDGIAYWMGPDNFYMYNGSVMPIPNVEDIRKYVFDQISTSTSFQANAVYVAKYHEIWFFYTSNGATNPNAYVIYHINDQCWSVGTADFYSSVGVTAGVSSGSHFSAGDTSPYMAHTDGYLYNHDPLSGNYDDNGNPLTWNLTLAPLALEEGLTNVDLEGIVFDFYQQVGNVYATVNTYDRLTDLAPMDTQSITYPDTEGGITDFRLSGRYLSLEMTGSDAGNYMRFGKPVAFIKPAGTRR